MKYFNLKQKIKNFPLFSSSMLKEKKTGDTLKVQLSKWRKKGLISKLKKGLYTLSKDERIIEPTCFYLANQIFLPSYISLESALSYYGLIPEFVAETTSVTSRKTCAFVNEFGTFTYRHIKRDGYGGFVSLKENNNFSILMATREKALIDFIYLNLSKFNIDDSSIFSESYRFQNCENLSKKKLKIYAKSFKSKKLLLIVELFIKELMK